MTQDTNKDRFFKLDLDEAGISYVRAMSPEAARESVLQEHLSDGIDVGEPAELTEAEFDAAVEALFGL